MDGGKVCKLQPSPNGWMQRFWHHFTGRIHTSLLDVGHGIWWCTDRDGPRLLWYEPYGNMVQGCYDMSPDGCKHRLEDLCYELMVTSADMELLHCSHSLYTSAGQLFAITAFTAYSLYSLNSRLFAITALTAYSLYILNSRLFAITAFTAYSLYSLNSRLFAHTAFTHRPASSLQ